MSSPQPQKTRMNLPLNTRQKNALENLSEQLGTSKVDVIKRALSLLTIALKEQDRGNKIAVVSGQKVVKEIVGIG